MTFTWRTRSPNLTVGHASAASGAFWRASDWRNWRKRVYKALAESVGIDGARPYNLRHAFASLLIHEGRKSVVEIAAQLGHNPTVCLDTYAHVMAEQEGGERIGAEEQIVQARATLTASSANPDAQPALPFRGADRAPHGSHGSSGRAPRTRAGPVRAAGAVATAHGSQLGDP